MEAIIEDMGMDMAADMGIPIMEHIIDGQDIMLTMAAQPIMLIPIIRLTPIVILLTLLTTLTLPILTKDIIIKTIPSFILHEIGVGLGSSIVSNLDFAIYFSLEYSSQNYAKSIEIFLI